MMRKALVLLCTLLVAGLAAAQMKKPAAPPTPPAGALQVQPQAAQQVKLDSVRRVTIDEAYKMMQKGEAVLVDVRSNAQFQLGHIRGAVSIPGSQMLARLKELPPRKMIITYCACTAEQSSGRAVLDLTTHGVKNTAALKGGWDAWKRAGLPTATGAN